MKQITRVLAAVDFSRPARSAFEYAFALSRHHRAELIVVHAVPLDEPASLHARERLTLMAKLRGRAEAAGIRFDERRQQGDPAEIILLHARALQPDVVVVGTHQRAGVERLRKGSVGERVASRAGMPVLLVPERRRTAIVGRFHHVAVAVDMTDGSGRAVEQALALTGDPGDRITLLHVVPGYADGVPPVLYRYGIAEYQDALVRDARRRLQEAVPMRRSATTTIHTRVLVGDTTDEISRALDSIGADLLIVGVPKRGFLSRALVGSPASRLVRAARVPVLVVPRSGSVDEGTGEDRPARPLAA